MRAVINASWTRMQNGTSEKTKRARKLGEDEWKGRLDGADVLKGRAATFIKASARGGLCSLYSRISCPSSRRRTTGARATAGRGNPSRRSASSSPSSTSERRGGGRDEHDIPRAHYRALRAATRPRGRRDLSLSQLPSQLYLSSISQRSHSDLTVISQ